MKYRIVFVMGMLVVAAACSPQPATGVPSTEAVPTQASRSTTDANLSRSDDQGAVKFVLTPLNLDTAGVTLDFNVSMNTHAVDLGWDLAAQSVLKTDTGQEVTGQSWPVGSGHHYEGTLTFPVTAASGEPLLNGATTLTLSIRDTDVAERVFTWNLPVTTLE